MAPIRPIKITNFRGGLNLNDDTQIEDNQLSLATNVFYDQDSRLTSRRGIQNFGEQIPDGVVTLNDCDATTNFVATDDAANIAAGAAIRGANSVEFDVVVATTGNDFATVTNASLGTIDMSAGKGYIGLWLFVPTGFNTNLTDVKVRLGSDAANYYEWTFPTLTENTNNFVKLDFSSATTTGVPVDTSIDFFRLQITYTGAYLDQLNLLLDDIVAYSDTSTDSVHSIKFWETSDGTKRLNAFAGTTMYEYDSVSTGWFIVEGGFTAGLRFSFTIYNDELYFTNGTDDYRQYDGTIVNSLPGVQKGKYLLVANDIGYLAGVDGTASTLYYTGAVPADLTSFPNSVDIESDNGQIITGLANLGPIVLVFKERSIYDVNVATPSREQLDYSGGGKSHRTIQQVENDILFLSDNGVFSLAQREGTTGSLRADPLTKDLQPLIDTLKNTDISAAIYWPTANQYYLAVDPSDDGSNTGLLVYNPRVQAWTTYTGVNANDFTVYIDEDEVEHLLYGDAFSGRVKEMESGFSDNNVGIVTTLGTKSYDFEEPSLAKEYREHDIIGFISEDAEIEVTVEIDGADVITRTILGSTYKGGPSSFTLGATPLGISPLGGGPALSDALTLFNFKARIPVYFTGVNTKIKLRSNKVNTAWVLNKVHIVPDPEPFDFFPTAQIL